jgi:hypothetical protein
MIATAAATATIEDLTVKQIEGLCFQWRQLDFDRRLGTQPLSPRFKRSNPCSDSSHFGSSLSF